MELNGLSAVITGHASGLGEATARVLAAEGVKIALFDIQAHMGEAVAGEIGGTYCRVDVTDEASIDGGFSKARATHGQERILINCVGMGEAIKTAICDRKAGEIQHSPVKKLNLIIQLRSVGSNT